MRRKGQPRRDAVARAKHHHPAGVESLARDRDRALDDIDPAVLVILGQGSAGARLQRRVGVERVGKDGDGRCFAKGAAEDQPKAYALGFDDRQRLLAVVLEARRVVLVRLRQGDPGLNAVQRWRRRAVCAPVRSEWAMPRPAVIQLTSPGRMTCLSRGCRGARSRRERDR